MLLIFTVLAAADPEACARVDRLDKQLAAVRAPLPAAAERSYVDEEGELMLRALATVEPAAVDELLELKAAGRARLAEFLGTLSKDSSLTFAVEQVLQDVDDELTRAASLKRIFTPARAAEAKARLASRRFAGWEKLFGPDESTARDDLGTLVRNAGLSPERWAPTVAWFGGGMSDPATRCASGTPPGSVLLGSALARGADGGWKQVLDGAELAAWARAAARVKSMSATRLEVGCGKKKVEPKVRYDAAKRSVDYDQVTRVGCLDGLRGKLQLNLPDHGAMPMRKAGDVTPEPDWAPVRAKLLAP